MILSKTKVTNIFNYHFTIMLTFLFVFGTPFTFLSINSSKLVFLFLLGMSLLKLTSSYRLNTKIDKTIFTFSLMLLFMFVVSLIYTIGHNTMDFFIPYAYFIFLFEALFGAYLLYTLFLKKYSFEEVLHILIVVSLIQSLIIIGMFVFEPFRDLIFAIAGSKEDLMSRYGGFRGFGLAGSVTYDLSVFLSIGMMFIASLVSQSPKNRFFYLMSWIVIFIAVLMTGRTGWIGVFLSLLILFLNFRNKNSIKSIGYLIFSILFFMTIFIYSLLNFFSEVYRILLESVIPYGFEMFINLFETGSMSTTSSDILQKMYFDVSVDTFLWGDGYWASPDGNGYYMATDAGYMRHILFYGIFPSLFLYLLYLFGFYKVISSVKYTISSVKYTFSYKLLFFMLCGYFFLTQYKGDFFTGSAMNIKLFTVLFVFISMKNIQSGKDVHLEFYENNTIYRQYS